MVKLTEVKELRELGVKAAGWDSEGNLTRVEFWEYGPADVANALDGLDPILHEMEKEVISEDLQREKQKAKEKLLYHSSD